MTEAIQPRRELIGNRGIPNDSLDDQDVLATIAYVTVAGGRAEPLPVAGMTVGVIRRRLADRLNIDPTYQPMISTQDVGDDVVLRAGEYLYFHRQAGEKGISCLE